MLGGLLRKNGLEIGLDNYAPAALSYISHAHSDHVNCSKQIYSSPETFDLLQAMGKPVEHMGNGNEHNFSLHNAGHILGSTQLAVETDGAKCVYTGDFKLVDGLTTKGAGIVECDTLMIESTYGLPEYVFPDREMVLGEMGKFAKSHADDIIIFGSYEVGKAQELIKFLNSHCSVVPVVNRKISKFCKTYEKHGVKLEYAEAGTSEAEELMKGGFSAVLPRKLINAEFKAMMEHAHHRKCYTAIATGWALKYSYGMDRMFALSDHADFRQICEYVEGSNAKKVICMHGYEEELATNLRERGIDAHPFK